VNTASNIYNFSDYREFLKDRYRQLKEIDPVFSFRNFSKQAGFGSPNYLKLVMDGKRNLSFEAIAKFAKGLRLDNHESEFFRYLVECNQCDIPTKRQVFEAKLMYLRELFKVKTLIPELYDYYHDWYHSAIYEMVKKGRVKNDPSWIAASLVPSISEEEARLSISLLGRLNYVSLMDGYLQAEQPKVDTKSVELAQKIHYEQMAELAAQSLYTQGPDTQDFGAITLSLPADKVGELKEKIHALITQVAGSGSENPGDAVFQLNIQLFALTKPATNTNDKPQWGEHASKQEEPR
jgi:uncharacterized protein (TIGR02147 family)